MVKEIYIFLFNISKGTGFDLGSRDGVVVRAIASHQCGPGSIPRSGVICGLSLVVLFFAPGSFLRVFQFPLSSKKHQLTWFEFVIVNLSLQCLQLVLQR